MKSYRLALIQIVMLTSFFFATTATARTDNLTKEDYPLSTVERPMTLPPMMFAPFVEGGLTYANSSYNQVDLKGYGGTLAFGFAASIIPRLQLGLMFAFPLGPINDFGQFVVDLQGNVVPDVMNIRLDLGTERVNGTFSGFSSTTSYTQDSFLMGVGLPLKVKLHRMFAFISSSPWGRGFASQPLTSVSSNGLSASFFGGVYSDDLFSLLTYENSGTRIIVGAVHIPIGLVFQPHPMMAIGVRTGYRYVFTHTNDGQGSTSTTQDHFVPLGFDLVVTPHRMVDIGFTATVYGPVASQDNGDASHDIAKHYTDLSKFDLWVTGRF